MAPTKGECIEVALEVCSQSQREVADEELNCLLPKQQAITKDSPSKRMKTFLERGRADDKPQSGRPMSAIDYKTSDALFASCGMCFRESVRHIFVRTDVRFHRWHSFTLLLLQKLNKDNPGRHMEFCQWVRATSKANGTFSIQAVFR